jgi:hypothetical protein
LFGCYLYHVPRKISRELKLQLQANRHITYCHYYCAGSWILTWGLWYLYLEQSDIWPAGMTHAPSQQCDAWATEVKTIHLDFVHCPSSVLHNNQNVLGMASIFIFWWWGYEKLLCLVPILHMKHVRVLHHQTVTHVITKKLLDYILT